MALFTSNWLYDFLLFLPVALAAVYGYFQNKFKYWGKRNVPLPRVPNFPMGHFSGMNMSKSLTIILHELYKNAGDNKFFGTYFITRPIFVVKDLDVVKNILVKDFSIFHDRGFTMDFEREPLSGHLFMMNGQEWRNLRVKLTPTFTSGKMKMMFPTLLDVGKELEKMLHKCAKDDETEIKDVLARFTTDVISSVAFGIETNCLNNPDAEFRKMGLALLKPGIKQVLVGFLMFLFPKAIKYIPFSIVPSNINDFFINIVRDTMDYRNNNNIKRNDFMQLLLQLKNVGYVADADNAVKDEDPSNTQKFTIPQAAAQAFLFFFAGFETSASTMVYALYELALNPEVQSRLQIEMDTCKSADSYEFTYEAVQGMDYLDRVVSETLRKYPFANVLMRETAEEYTIPDSDTVLDKGTTVWITAYGIHHDPKYYPNPDKFDPDRFLPEEVEKRPNYTYLPFGEGPRSCIGNRFALMQIKTGLCILLSKFSVSPSKQTPIPIVFDPKTDMNPMKFHLKISSR